MAVPEIFFTDLGAQLASEAFPSGLEETWHRDKHGRSRQGSA